MEDELKANYIALHEGTGESYESIAARVEAVGDKRVAAELRALAGGDAPEARTEPPVARTAGNLPVTTSASETPPTGDTETAAE